MTARCEPSGDQTTASHEPLPGVSFRGSPEPSAGTTYTSLTSFTSQSSSRAETNASCAPSGDHEGDASSKSPLVTCLASPDPSVATTKRCWRRSPVQPTLSSL